MTREYTQVLYINKVTATINVDYLWNMPAISLFYDDGISSFLDKDSVTDRCLSQSCKFYTLVISNSCMQKTKLLLGASPSYW